MEVLGEGRLSETARRRYPKRSTTRETVNNPLNLFLGTDGVLRDVSTLRHVLPVRDRHSFFEQPNRLPLKRKWTKGSTGHRLPRRHLDLNGPEVTSDRQPAFKGRHQPAVVALAPILLENLNRLWANGIPVSGPTVP